MDLIKSEIKPEPQRSEYDDIQIDFGDFDNDADSDTETLCPRDRTKEILADVEIPDDEFQNEEVIKNIEEVQRELNVELSVFKVPLPCPPIQQPATESVQPMQKEEPFTTITSDNDYFLQLYSERLQSKVKEAREKVQMFANTVKSRYRPSLTDVIDANERKYDGFFCEFLPPRQSPIEKSFSGTWKFKVRRIVVIGEKVCKVKYAVNRLFEGIKKEDEIDLPPHIQRFVKDFEEFLNENPVIQKGLLQNPAVLKNQSKDFYKLHLHSNFKLEIMTIAYGHTNATNEMRDALTDWANLASQRLKLVSVYLRTPSGEKNKKLNTDHVYGQRKVMKNVGGLNFNITPITNFYFNIAGLEVIYETLVSLIKNFEYHSVVMIGSGMGLIPLLLAKDIKDVVGIEVRRVIQDAETIRKSNKICNVRFVELEDEKKVDMIFQDIKNQKFFAIIDNNMISGQNSKLLERLQKMISLKHIVVISAFNQPDVESLTRFFEPIDAEKILPFYPVKGCVVDPTPTSDHYQVVVLLERFEIENLTNESPERASRKCFDESAEIKLESKLDDKNQSNEEKQYMRSDPRRENLKRNLEEVDYVEPENEVEVIYQYQDRNWSSEKRPKTDLIENVNVLEDCLKRMQKTVIEGDKSGSLNYLKTASDQLSSMKDNIISISLLISGPDLSNDRKRKISEVVTIE